MTEGEWRRWQEEALRDLYPGDGLRARFNRWLSREEPDRPVTAATIWQAVFWLLIGMMIFHGLGML
jgi:hypothetical protein